MIRPARQFVTIVAKDLRIEARGRQTIGLVVVLGILIMTVLGLGLGADGPLSGFSATAILWVSYLFGGVMCFEKTMAVERYDDALAGLLVAPVDRSVIYAAKLVTNMILMLSLAIVVTPVAVMLFHFDLSAHPFAFMAIMALGMTGFAALGTLFSAAVSSTRLQGGLLAILVFTLTLPIVIGSTQMMRQLYQEGGSLDGRNLLMLFAADVAFLVMSWLVFELVLEP